MRTIKFIIQKEFLQISRNKQMLPIIFGLPIIQLLVLVYAATFEIKRVDVHLIDDDKTTSSRQLAEKFSATNRFFFVNSSQSDRMGYEDLARNDARMIIKIPKDFEKDIITGRNPKVQFVINAEDGASAGVIYSYATAIIMDYNNNIASEFANTSLSQSYLALNICERYWYNPELDYKHYMAPGILVLLVTAIGMFLSSMSIVKEKEIGTIEQLNVTPIKKREFIIGKLIPFWIIALFDLALGLIIAKLAYNIPIVGNIFLIFFLASIFLLVVQSFGLLVSTLTETQQQAMFISWFFLVVFILMSGLFTPIDSMPRWAQTITQLNPIAHFVEIMRRVLLKGAGLWDVFRQFWILLIYAVVMLTLSVWRYRKVSS